LVALKTKFCIVVEEESVTFTATVFVSVNTFVEILGHVHGLGLSKQTAGVDVLVMVQDATLPVVESAVVVREYAHTCGTKYPLESPVIE
jgi:hypothetical protein